MAQFGLKEKKGGEGRRGIWERKRKGKERKGGFERRGVKGRRNIKYSASQ